MKHKSTNDERYEQLSKFILPILFVLKFVSCSSFKITSSFFVILLLPVEIKIATQSQNAARCERHFCFVYSLSKAKAGGPAGRRRQGEAGPGVEGVQGEAASSRAQKESGFVPADLEKPSAGGGRREGRGGTFQRRGGSRRAVDAARPDLGCRQCLCPDSPLALQLGLGALAPPPQVLGALETQASGPGLAGPVVKPTLRAVSRGGSVVPVTSPQEGVGPLGSLLSCVSGQSLWPSPPFRRGQNRPRFRAAWSGARAFLQLSPPRPVQLPRALGQHGPALSSRSRDVVSQSPGRPSTLISQRVAPWCVAPQILSILLRAESALSSRVNLRFSNLAGGLKSNSWTPARKSSECPRGHLVSTVGGTVGTDRCSRPCSRAGPRDTASRCCPHSPRRPHCSRTNARGHALAWERPPRHLGG